MEAKGVKGRAGNRAESDLSSLEKGKTNIQNLPAWRTGEIGCSRICPVAGDGVVIIAGRGLDWYNLSGNKESLSHLGVVEETGSGKEGTVWLETNPKHAASSL